MYVFVFILSGAGLLAIVNSLARSLRDQSSSGAAVAQRVAGGSPQLRAQAEIRQLQAQLAQSAASGSHGLLVGSAIALGVMALVSVGLGWIVAGRVLRPLRTMTAAAQRISENNLHARLAVTGPSDEMKDLGNTIDGLLERLEGAFAAQRRFVANASHELRTPLTTMRATLDVAVGKPGPVPPETIVLAGRLRTQLDQVDQLLDGLLILARAQHGNLPGRARIQLASVVTDALRAGQPAIVAKGLTIVSSDDAVDAPAGTLVEASQALLRSMVDNVLDNAITHNEHGGWIRVSTEADGVVARLIVETGGEVLDQQKVQRLTEPFKRLGPDRTGSGNGLGLSIVAAIAAAHGGVLDLTARPEGGLRVSIALPLAADRVRVGVPA